MTNVFIVVVSVAGMLGLWALAWSLWKRADVAPTDEHTILVPPVWVTEPSPEFGETVAPPDWVFDDRSPRSRTHPSSSANTRCYSREDLELQEVPVELTEVLEDGDLGSAKNPPVAETPAQTGRLRETGLFPPPWPQAGRRSTQNR